MTFRNVTATFPSRNNPHTSLWTAFNGTTIYKGKSPKKIVDGEVPGKSHELKCHFGNGGS